MFVSVNVLGNILASAMLLVNLSSAILIGMEGNKLAIEIIYFTSTAAFCLVIIKLTRNVFIRHVFTWFMGFDMFLYLLFYLVMVVTVMSSNFEYRKISIFLMVTDCGLMFAYTKCITVCYLKHRELLNIRRQARQVFIESNRQKPTSHKSTEGCIYLPVTEDDE